MLPSGLRHFLQTVYISYYSFKITAKYSKYVYSQHTTALKNHTTRKLNSQIVEPPKYLYEYVDNKKDILFCYFFK